MTTSAQTLATDLNCRSEGVFDGVFATRGSVDTAESNPSGAFEKVFVKRGRWRKTSLEGSAQSTQSNGNVLHLAEHVSAGAPDIASLSDVTDQHFKIMDPILEDPARANTSLLQDGSDPMLTAEVNDSVQFVVKNTFLNTANLVRNSLKDFLSERQVQSCPVQSGHAGSIDIDDIDGMDDDLDSDTESAPDEAILNTALSWQQLRTMSFDDPSFLPESLWKSLAFNHSEGACTFEQDAVYNTASTVGGEKILIDQAAFEQMLVEDRLNTLRIASSQIQQMIAECSEPAMNPPMQFMPMEACFPPPPCMPPAVMASMMQQVPPPPPMEVAFAGSAVLRLAEALPPPELGGPLAPSMGSLLHHHGECKPCTFFHTRGCENKEACQFCHLCAPGEKKKRLRAEKRFKRESQFVAVQNARAILASLDAAEGMADVDFIVE